MSHLELALLSGRRFSTLVRAEDDMMRGHLVHEVPVLPGVFHLDLVLRLVRHVGIDPSRVELRRCLFVAPVVASGVRDRQLHVEVGAANALGTLAVTITSRAVEHGEPVQQEWETNFRAELVLDPADDPLSDPPAPARAGEDADADADADELYAFARQLHIQHGDFMKVRGRVRGGAGAAIADVRLGPAAEAFLDHFYVHPVLLDFSVLVPFLQFERQVRATVRTPYIPIFIERFRAREHHRAGAACVHVPPMTQRHIDAATETVTADIHISDPDGRPLATLSGYRAKRVRSAEHLTRLLTGGEPPPAQPETDAPAPVVLEDVVAELVAGELGVAVADVDRERGFYDLGLSSVQLLSIAGELERVIGAELYPTLLFEHPTVVRLAGHLNDEGLAPRAQDGVAGLAPLSLTGAGPPAPAAPVRRSADDPPDRSTVAHRSRGSTAPTAAPGRTAAVSDEEIAIVGLAGRYPSAPSIWDFWTLLREGRDCVGEIPSDRWDSASYYDPGKAPGTSYSKWGSFLDGVGDFDPDFFAISPRQAALLDPHERLFLETAWSAVEDAGHTPETLGAALGRQVGVFVGVIWADYQLYGLEEILKGNPEVAQSWTGSVATRVSYTLDLEGPSVSLDTACSSSLVALHLACESIRRGECRAAIAGGVNLTLHPYKYLRLAQDRLLSSDGRCRVFGRDADGYVPGEGVGAALVRPLADAEADGDHIYGVIRGSALMHSGRTSGYTVPSPDAESRVIEHALERSEIDAGTITYVEAHGAGTALGDQIEVEALTRVYRRHSDRRGYCAIGSLKSNVGHLEGAAGIAALSKTLLSMRHGKLVPSLHSDPLNPGIRFEDTPFYVSRELADWDRTIDPASGEPVPRRAAISTFGAGGANVHVIVEEHLAAPAPPPAAGLELIPLSARSRDRLDLAAGRLAGHLRAHGDLALADVAHTLRAGRRPMAERLAVVATDTGQLAHALEEFAAGRTEGVLMGRAERRGPAPEPVARPTTIDDARALGRSWTLGGDLPGTALAAPGARRVALPTYQFARERCWISRGSGPVTSTVAGTTLSAVRARTSATHPAAATDERPDTRAGVAGDVLLYAPAWSRCEAAPACGGPRTLLVLDADSERAAELGLRGHRVTRVRPGRELTAREDGYELDPADDRQVADLVARLRAEGIDPDAVLCLWALDGEGPAADDGLLCMFALCRALALHRRATLPIVYAFGGQPADPAHVAVGGLARGVRLEQPKLALKTVHVAIPPGTVAGMCDLLEAELSAGEELEVRYRDARQVRGFHRARWLASDRVPLARDGGVYVITGGAGGLGLHLAERLAAIADVAIVLLGRSRVEYLAPPARARLDAIGARYLRCDVARLPDVLDAFGRIEAQLGPPTGIVHAAGVVEDGLLVNKELASVRRVLAPKRDGARNLDLACRMAPLDYFVLFSSAVAVLGSIGTSDYTAANRGLDAFAEWREALRARGERSGRTVSVSWPLWRDGGMRINPAVEAQVLESSGLRPLETAEGLWALEGALGAPGAQLAVLPGDRERIEQRLASLQPVPPAEPVGVDVAPAGDASGALERELLECFAEILHVDVAELDAAEPLPEYGGDDVAIMRAVALYAQRHGVAVTGVGRPRTIRELAARVGAGAAPSASNASFADAAAETSRLPDKVAGWLADTVRGLLDERLEFDDASLYEASLMELGVDSAGLIRLLEAIENELGVPLPATALFRYPSVPDLVEHLAGEHAAALAGWAGRAPVDAPPATAARPVAVAPRQGRGDDSRIAVIGMAGRFPGAADVDALWDALRSGRDLVSPVPASRWDHGRYLDRDGAPDTTPCPAGGFVDGVDAFDAGFFGVRASEAEAMDPQQRLLLEVLYTAAEDAAVAACLRGSDTGVFVGQCFHDYDGEMIDRRRPVGVYDPTGIALAMTANRPSYALDLHGPSLTVDTACSSSLYALQLAIEALRRGECAMAFAAGVNLILSPRHYLRLSAIGALSPSGRCHAFDARADGYVPGEAVAAVLLKPLEAALADGDPIHAIIGGVAVGHGGHASSVTAPNPDRQADLLAAAWERASIDPVTLGLLEAHGTGTQLGDPVEVDGANRALRRGTDRRRFCALGTAKAHLGHTEASAGVVGVIKAALSLQHELIPAMPGYDEPNPMCALDDGPLFVNHEPLAWPRRPGEPRHAGVSSFGFGGAYAHVVLEEAPEQAPATACPGPFVFPFSARSVDRLEALVTCQRAALAAGDQPLVAVAATLQHGREAMAERLAVVAGSRQELIAALDAFLAGDARPARVLGDERDATALARAHDFVAGETVVWPPAGVPRARLATYPFARERYWLTEDPVSHTPASEPAGSDPATIGARRAAEAAAFAGYDGPGVLEGLRRLSRIGGRLLAEVCRGRLGVTGAPGEDALTNGLSVIEEHERLLDVLRPIVGAAGEPAGDAAAERAAIDAELAQLLADHPQLDAHVALLDAYVPELPDVLEGRLDPLELLFAGERADLLPRIYRGNAVADHYNELAARAVEGFVAQRGCDAPGRKVRILEVGAGTGGTTSRVLELLAPHAPDVEYTFTDVSASFLATAEASLGGGPVAVRFDVLDLDAEPDEQGFEPEGFDIVLGANVLHATRRIDATLARARRLLADGGLLVLNEVCCNLDFLALLFGTIPGWWAFEDAERRLPGAPLLDVANWRQALGQAGFGAVWPIVARGVAEHEADQAVLLARTGEMAPQVGDDAGDAASGSPSVREAATQPGEPARQPAGATVAGNAPDVEERVREHLREAFATFLRVPRDRLDDAATFEHFGLDSLGAIQLVRNLEADFGRLPKVLLYECTTIAAVAANLMARNPEASRAIAAGARGDSPGPAGAARARGRAPNHAADAESAAHGGPGPAGAARVEPPPGEPAATPPQPLHRAAEPVAIVGMAGVFPGSPDIPALWAHLRDAVDLIGEVPAERFDWRRIFGDPRREEGKTDSRWGGFVDGIDRFDAAFFGISPLEAELMDPQQRLFLQVAWHAIEDAGHPPSELRGTRTGVFVGATTHDYWAHLMRAARDQEALAMSGNAHCVIANRVSYELDLHGPSETVDTACSSSLTALHRALRSIEAGDCDAALVGGVNLILIPELFVAFGQMGMLSPDGRCMTFDRRANGFVRGEGVVALLLKPLSRALADGDSVHALILGAGVGHGGQVQSLPVPNPSAQADVIASVHRRTGVDPRTIGYVEAHGTGTEVGDPIELHGLRKAYAELTGRPEDEPIEPWCAIGTIKSNMGHLEAAAGLAGVVKAVLALRHRTLPASLHFEQPNPLLEIENSPFAVVDRTRAWDAPRGEAGATLPRRAGVSSLGFGGSNAHVLLEEHREPRVSPPPGGPELVVLSARSEEQLRASAAALAHYLRLRGGYDRAELSLADVAYTLQVGRDRFQHRLAVVASSLEGLIADLRAVVEVAADGERVLSGRAEPRARDRIVPPEDPADLRVAAHRWVGGTEVDWVRVRPAAGPRRRVPLPGYPFAPDRHWIDADPFAPKLTRDAQHVAGGRPSASDPGERELVDLLTALQRGERSLDEVDRLLTGDDGGRR